MRLTVSAISFTNDCMGVPTPAYGKHVALFPAVYAEARIYYISQPESDAVVVHIDVDFP